VKFIQAELFYMERGFKYIKREFEIMIYLN